MIFFGTHNERYETGQELGKGGEGSVYELNNHKELVLKKYNEPLSAEKIQKIELMVAMRSPDIETYAAWPIDLALDNTGAVCGFVMKKLTGYVPLHHVFSPMDRKKMFPDKGYNFLVHVGRNIATAFYKLHEAGLVVGDVNEGNLLISSSGIANFIDCDSFQVKNNDSYYFCEVGVPRYTPPELLKKSTFEKVVRTTNTDNFSLAVLLFQLLFLGRHPFAGKHKGAADIDEETAIRQQQFAYSVVNQKKKLTPPPDSLPINNLPLDIVTCFHRAFEQEERPQPTEWIKMLDALLAEMSTCSVSKLHTYPAMLAECPWCMFRKEKGIMYFLDDSYFQANTALGNIEQFVSGFNVQRPEVKKWSYSKALPILKPTPLSNPVKRAYQLRKWISIGTFVAAISAAYFHVSITVYLLLTAAYIYMRSPWAKMINKEKAEKADRHIALSIKMNTMIRDYENPPDIVIYNKSIDTLQRLVSNFKLLPHELEQRRKKAEEILYNEQLDDYLWQFGLDDHSIPSVGPAKKSALYNNGIRNAAQITLLSTTKVPGIGPANEQILLAWRRQMSLGFVYIPDNNKLNSALMKVNSEIAQIRQQLEHNIRKEYQSLNFLKLNINNRLTMLEKQIELMYLQVKQAELDSYSFKKMAA
ncbi:MAG: protein kinase [Taibaiella sp.]|nr:protein kinase [Taibaiella sp.]